jgi:prolyl-tRNA synthetase
VALVRGDHEVNEAKLCRAAKVPSVKAADAELIRKVTGAEVGFAGPVGLRPYAASPSPSQGEGRGEGVRVRVIADQAVTIMHDAVTGANKTDYHITGVNPARDFQIQEWADIRMAVEGDRAPNGSPLIFKKCIEVGHVFKLGTKYSVAMEATCLDGEGKTRPFIMGCYGIGLNRIMAAAIEAMHDEQGICWPMSIAPFQVVICVLDTRDAKLVSLAQRLHDEMQAAGIEVLLDDRDVRAGVKFNDADLIGFPLRINIGKRGLDEGIVEIRKRRTGETLKLPPEKVTPTVSDLIRTLLREERT